MLESFPDLDRGATRLHDKAVIEIPRLNLMRKPNWRLPNILPVYASSDHFLSVPCAMIFLSFSLRSLHPTVSILNHSPFTFDIAKRLSNHQSCLRPTCLYRTIRCLQTTRCANSIPVFKMATKKPAKFEVREYTTAKNPAPASPSASIILVSPNNTILLLHRRQNSSAFPSAHVFPGGNLDPSDGPLPSDPKDVNRHLDSTPYRIGAIRELFEETGILLAKESASATSLLTVSDSARLAGRKAVHKSSIQFQEWLHQQSSSAVLHTEGLIPFTHWVTPANVPKRFTTQMYVYFVHLKETGNPSVHPTADEVETMAPEYRTAREWMAAAQKGEVILFPPQFFLLHLISQFLDHVEGGEGGMYGKVSAAEIVSRRRKLYEFITTNESPPWSQKFISPIGQGMAADGRAILHLANGSPELRDSELKGDDSRVVLVKFNKEGPRQLEVRMRKEVLEEVRQQQKRKEEKL